MSLYDFDEHDCFGGPAIYTARTALCLDCNALLTEEDQRKGYDLCGRCGLDRDDEEASALPLGGDTA